MKLKLCLVVHYLKKGCDIRVYTMMMMKLFLMRWGVRGFDDIEEMMRGRHMCFGRFFIRLKWCWLCVYEGEEIRGKMPVEVVVKKEGFE